MEDLYLFFDEHVVMFWI